MRLVIIGVLGAMLIACASGGNRRPAARDADRITFAEIETLQVATAFEVVQQLRPEFLRTRGPASVTSAAPVEAVVYLDGVRQGGPEALRRIRKQTLREIQYLDSREATTQFGTGHRAGAIMVVTR